MKSIRYLLLLSLSAAPLVASSSTEVTNARLANVITFDEAERTLQISRDMLRCVDGELYASVDGQLIPLISVTRLDDGFFRCQILEREAWPFTCPEGHLLDVFAGGCVMPGCPYYRGRGP